MCRDGIFKLVVYIIFDIVFYDWSYCFLVEYVVCYLNLKG